MAAYAVEASMGGRDTSGTYEETGDAYWSAWNEPGASEAPLLPFWEDQGEEPEHQGTIFSFHTEPCTDFQSGYCSLHRPKGKASPCFCYHFESQHRRPPCDSASGRLLYWDVPCHSMGTETPCPSGNGCMFAHSREEISYHPAKYKTRRCNGRGCRGEAICCFAHTESELRIWAPERYSYWALMSSSARAAGRGPDAVLTGGGSLEWSALAPGAVEDWQRPLLSREQPAATRHKQRFCASYPDVSQCRRGAACNFAHSREEARTPLLTLEQEQQKPDALTEEFFMYKFKTLWCPIGVQHDWQTCVYAHNYQDARRQVSIGYGPRPCPYWAKKDPNAEYAQRCPLGLRCPFSHGAKEQLYHPQYFRTVICRDLRAKACPRQALCAFFHRRAERRKPPTDVTDYNMPLKEQALPTTWVSEFLNPPFRDAAPMSAAPGSAGDAIVEGLVDRDAGAAAMAASVDDAAFWCDPCAYWDPSSVNDGSTALATDSIMSTAMMGLTSELMGLNLEMNSSDPLALDKSVTRSSVLPFKAAPSDGKYDSYNWRLSLLSTEMDLDGEGTPRTQAGESGPEDEDSSTSTTNRDLLAPTGRARTSSGGGAIGTAITSGVNDGANSMPRTVEAPSYGLFGGSFDGLPGILTGQSLANSSSYWDPTEPQMVS
mmetsp:Transcript_58845/g.97724  ORF Transcript_58845/g.97724 Transcript_58845/m.97724 type:complete len:657 (-) Transcript_58845:207-2177(-)